MITIISGTNRPNNNSLVVAKYYKNLCDAQDVAAEILNLEDLPADFLFSASYGKVNPDFDAFIAKFIRPATKLLFVVPEYNGSFPGVLKSFMDCVSPSLFHGKKSALVGLSSGHAGNLRGLDHFTGILHFLQVEVMAAKPKLSSFESLVSDSNLEINDVKTQKMLVKHLETFLKF